MLYAWNDTAAPVVVEALTDEHWRPREMALKVIAKRIIDAPREVTPLREDPVPRVQAAADRALQKLTAGG